MPFGVGREVSVDWWSYSTQAEVEAVMRAEIAAYADDVLPFGAPAVRFGHVDNSCPNPALRLGGGAELPVGIGWPVMNDLPMHFLAVVDLAAAAEEDQTGLLPTEGCLYFFADLVRGLWRPGSAGLVMHVLEPPGTFPMQFREANPADDQFALPSTIPEQRQVSAYAQWTLPDLFEDCLGDLWYGPDRNPESDDFDKYGEFIRIAEEQMLGWPSLRQGSMQAVCESEASGIDIGDVPAELADQWKLLLQYTYNGDETISALELGTLYYWIREADLRAQRFDKAILISQFE